MALPLTRTRLPMMCAVQRSLPRGEPVDIHTRMAAEWARLKLGDQVRDKHIALGFGSRGVAEIATIAQELVTLVKMSGGHPFIVPAMGSHGGATPQGQIEVLNSLGITEEAVGCPIRATMETVVLGETENGVPVYTDRYAAEADGVIIVNRVKPHTDFHSETESGLVKMLAIGLGKEDGASTIHQRGVRGLIEDLPQVAAIVQRELKLICGFATVEDGYHRPVELKALAPETLVEEEKALLKTAHALMPRLPVEDIDVLIVDWLGKDISGCGMDTNIIGRLRIDGLPEPESPRIKAIVVLDVTEASHGNALGIGLAEFITQRLFDKIDFPLMSKNVFTSGFLRRGYVPMVYPTAEEAVEAAIDHVYRANPQQRDQARVVRIRDTMTLETTFVSENLGDEIRGKRDFIHMNNPQFLQFNDVS